VDLYDKGLAFLAGLSASVSLYKEPVTGEVRGLESSCNVAMYGKRELFVLRKKAELFGRVTFAYVTLNPERKGRETKRLILQTTANSVKQGDLEYIFLRCGMMFWFFLLSLL